MSESGDVTGYYDRACPLWCAEVEHYRDRAPYCAGLTILDGAADRTAARRIRQRLIRASSSGR